MLARTVGVDPSAGNRWAGRSSLLALLALMPFWVTPAARGVTYTAADTIDLNPSSLLGSGSGSTAAGISGNQQVGYGSGSNTSSNSHVLLWSGTAASAIDLNPASLLGGSSSYSYAYGISGNQEVGYGFGTNTSNSHALLWSGTAASAIDLNPASLLGGSSSYSYAYGISGNQQVGYGSGSNTSSNSHALLWSGTAASAIDLNPASLLGSSSISYAYAISGNQQVGSGYGSNTSYNSNALLWNGTAASAVDLDPASLLGSGSNSYAQGTSGNQQVGYGSGPNTSFNYHALLWSGTAASAIDLNPALLGSSSTSFAYVVSGNEQVGYGSGSNTSGNFHALLWTGSAASAMDLNTLLPQGFISSRAEAIDAYGNISGFGAIGGSPHAVEWLAGDMYNIGGNGIWGTAGNWTSGTPAAGNDVLLLQQDATSRTITYISSATATPLGLITLDAAGSGTMTLLQASGTLSATNELIGDFGKGTFTQISGTHLVSGTMTLAANPGSQGTYTLNNAGAVLNAGTIILNSGGTFNQTTGTLVSNYFYQQGGTVTGTLTNQGSFIYTSGTFSGRLVNYGTVALDAAFTAGNGIENDGTMAISQAQPVTVNGAGLDNFGDLTLNGGLLAGSGTVTNDIGGVFHANGTISPTFVNYGQIYPTGLLVLNGVASNYAAITIASSKGLRANNNFTNAGSILLTGGSVSGTGTITNSAGGVIEGSGGVSNPIVNGGGLIVAADGQLIVTNGFNNNGYIQLLGSGALLSGGIIVNSGTIRGAGQIASGITNNGVIRPENGELDLNGVVTGGATSQIQIATGNTLFITPGLATNNGTIALSGGIFDNNNQPMNNTGTINGNGLIRTGGLTNGSGATLLLTDANSSVYGPVANSAGGNIKIVSNTTMFYGNVANNGTIKVTSGIARFLGNGVSMTVGGTYNSDPSDNYFNGLSILPGGLVTGGNGDRFFLTGSSNFSNAGAFTNGGTLSASTVTNSGTFTQTGPQFWSPGASFTNTAGSATFGSDAGSNGVNLSINAIGGSIRFNSDQHLVSLALIAGATVDLAGDELFITSTSAATIRSYLISAYDHGRWDANGLTSSLAAANAKGSTTLGYIATASAVEVKYTWLGDANLDGVVTSADLSAISSAGTTWATGDFNYDGVVNADDFALFMFGSAYGSVNISTTLPEPGVMLALGGLLCLRRARKA